MEPTNQIPSQMPQSPEEGSGMKWMIVIAVVVVVLAILGWMFIQKEKPQPIPQENAPIVDTQIQTTPSMPPTAGTIDDIISTLETANTEEVLISSSGDNDISLVTSDTDAVSGMNTLYNDNEF